MDLYIFLTVNIIWLTLSVLYHVQREFIWKSLQEVAVAITIKLAANPAVPFVVDIIRGRTPQINRKRKFIEFRYFAYGQNFNVPVPLNGEQTETHSYVLKKGGEEIGRLRLPARVPLLVTAKDLGCDEILPMEE